MNKQSATSEDSTNFDNVKSVLALQVQRNTISNNNGIIEHVV